MKKILHMTPMDVNSGVYRYIFNQYDYFDSDEFEFGFLTRAAEKLVLSPEYKKYGFNVHPFQATQRDDPDGLRKQVQSVLSQYDIVHLHTSSWRGFMIEEIAMELGLEKVIVHSHSTGIDISDSDERKIQIAEHYKYRNEFSKEYATHLCACSKNAARWLFPDSISDDEIVFLPNAIDVKDFSHNSEARKRIRTELEIGDSFVMGHVGRYSYTKNQSFLIELVAALTKEIPNIKLMCVGEGPCETQLKALARELGVEKNVIFVSWVSNISDYYQAMDVFCLPSVFEGFPISIVEAQAAGLPCIASDTITDEIEITNLVTRIATVPEKWISQIVGLFQRKVEVDYRDCENKLTERGFDVRSSAARLAKLWRE